ncbi:MAG: hypothetical protein KBA82_03740 [Nitrosomonas sp.]|jgi:hypothetical protein|nr:hypothetical protein [Nitrosomonas sp.]MBP7112084.1 hypothetical protein [Nitrosomonas sp.]
MRQISYTAIYLSIAHLLSIAALLLIYSVSALAKSNCESNTSLVNPAALIQSGIGGTGSPQSGIGGTGTPQAGIGGTGIHNGGIGGTGHPEGGIGGTGNVASDGGIGGTGVIGVITGFASICVNGVEIHYDSDTPVSVDGRQSKARDLAVGQVVAARAMDTGSELKASNIAVIHAAVGPITGINHENGKMHVLGQTVHIDQSKDHANFANLKTGDWIQVSGHRLASGTIVASRIETSSPLAEARVNGHAAQIDPKGFEINGTRINLDMKQLPSAISQGMEVSVSGHWDGNNLRAQQIQMEPMRKSIGAVEHIVIEGFVHTLNGKELNLGNRIVTLDSSTPITTGNARNDLRPDQRIQVSGRLSADQRIIAERIELKNESPIQIIERNDRSISDNDSKDKKNNSDNELETQSYKENGSNRSGSEHDDDNKGALKREINNNSGKSSSSDSDHRSKDSSHSFKDDNKSDHSGSSTDNQKDLVDKPEKAREPDSSDRPNDHRNNDLRDNDLSDKVRDHGDIQRDFDVPDRTRDHREHHDRHVDR